MYRYPHDFYQNDIRALSCIVRIETEVFVIFDVPVEVAVPAVLRLLLGNAKLAWLNTLSASARI